MFCFSFSSFCFFFFNDTATTEIYTLSLHDALPIPVHLITREALGVYLRHVTPHGIVAFHVSNRFLDLVPVVARIAREHAVHAVVVRDEPDDDDDSLRSKSDWVLVSRDAAALQAPAIVDAGAVPPEDRPDWRTWTDDYSNLIQILK